MKENPIIFKKIFGGFICLVGNSRFNDWKMSNKNKSVNELIAFLINEGFAKIAH